MVVDSVSCRQLYLRSAYTFSKKESVPEKTKKCFGMVRKTVAAAAAAGKKSSKSAVTGSRRKRRFPVVSTLFQRLIIIPVISRAPFIPWTWAAATATISFERALIILPRSYAPSFRARRTMASFPLGASVIAIFFCHSLFPLRRASVIAILFCHCLCPLRRRASLIAIFFCHSLCPLRRRASLIAIFFCHSLCPLRRTSVIAILVCHHLSPLRRSLFPPAWGAGLNGVWAALLCFRGSSTSWLGASADCRAPGSSLGLNLFSPCRRS
nr:uncharacterized protein LOC109155657 [Ipomoea batatas]